MRSAVPLSFPLFVFFLLGCSSVRQFVANEPCELDAARPFDVVKVDPAVHEIRLFWKDEAGRLFSTMDNVRRAVEGGGDSLVAVTNAGIFEPGFVPTGLYVEDGRVLQPLNLQEGEGNFFLKPNGVFVVTAEGAQIVEASLFSSLTSPVRYATQSGPLLVREGAIHPAFRKGSENCRLRSGVGVARDGTVYLAISNGATNFHTFATFFRDRLDCPDALYLDGGISELYAPGLGRTAAGSMAFAGFIAVIARRAGEDGPP